MWLANSLFFQLKKKKNVFVYTLKDK